MRFLCKFLWQLVGGTTMRENENFEITPDVIEECLAECLAD